MVRSGTRQSPSPRSTKKRLRGPEPRCSTTSCLQCFMPGTGRTITRHLRRSLDRLERKNDLVNLGFFFQTCLAKQDWRRETGKTLDDEEKRLDKWIERLEKSVVDHVSEPLEKDENLIKIWDSSTNANSPSHRLIERT